VSYIKVWAVNAISRLRLLSLSFAFTYFHLFPPLTRVSSTALFPYSWHLLTSLRGTRLIFRFEIILSAFWFLKFVCCKSLASRTSTPPPPRGVLALFLGFIPNSGLFLFHYYFVLNVSYCYVFSVYHSPYNHRSTCFEFI
jgi:hypothetical protein